MPQRGGRRCRRRCADLPRAIPGIDAIEVLVIDDGSRDGTADVARAHGVDHIVRLRRNKGLAAAFTAGIDACLKRGADFIVNTDADNQYAGARHRRSCSRRCCAARPTSSSATATSPRSQHMSWRKRQLQRLGSWVVRQVSNTKVPDTTSGFRAYTREAALRMTIVSEFSYTLESIIQAGKKRMAIAHVPIATNPRTRESRLFDSIFSYIKRSARDDRAHLRDVRAAEGLHLHRPARSSASGSPSRCGSSTTTCTGDGLRAPAVADRLPAVLMIVGFQVLLIGLLADVISANRKLLEDLLYRVRSLELPPREPSASDRRVDAARRDRADRWEH